MVRFLFTISCLILLFYSLPFIGHKIEDSDVGKAIDEIKTEINTVKDNPEALETIGNIFDEVQRLFRKLTQQLEELPQTERNKEVKKPELTTPANQIFSIHNIELGEVKEKIEGNLGPAKRASLNEYGTTWHAYHDNFQNFFMVMYDENNQAAGLYTNQDLVSSTNGIKLGTTKETVRATLGEPLTGIHKGLRILQLEENRDYDIYLLDDVYVTCFYDKHENNTVTAMQLISKNLEQQKTDFYTKASPELKEGFEYQMFDLTNAARVKHNLPILTWDDHVRETARKHSADMAVNQYFDHTNLKGQSPFDRMKEDHIAFLLAGENLAYGQFSSIFAHEGLMNSLGHRENILRNGYKYLGVGVAFNDQSEPYYTQNFYTK